MKSLKLLHWLGIVLILMYLVFALIHWKIQEYEIAKLAFVMVFVGGLSVFTWPIIAPKYSQALGVEPYRGRYSAQFTFAIVFTMLMVGFSSASFIIKDLIKDNFVWLVSISIVIALVVAYRNK